CCARRRRALRWPRRTWPPSPWTSPRCSVVSQRWTRSTRSPSCSTTPDPSPARFSPGHPNPRSSMENRGTRTTQHPSPAEKGPALNPKTHHTPEFPLLTSLAGGEPIENTRIVVELDTPSQHGWTRFTIRPGVVDADAVELYGYSKCHLLAGAVNALTGWRMCLIRPRRGGVWGWAHAGCVDASALFHDIHGPRNLDEVVEGVTEEYGLDADALVFDTFEECARFVMSGRAVTGWSEG